MIFGENFSDSAQLSARRRRTFHSIATAIRPRAWRAFGSLDLWLPLSPLAVRRHNEARAPLVGCQRLRHLEQRRRILGGDEE